MHSPNHESPASTRESLPRHPDAAAGPALSVVLGHLDSRHHDDRSLAVATVARLAGHPEIARAVAGSRDAVVALLAALGDHDCDVATHAAEALGWLCSIEAVDAHLTSPRAARLLVAAMGSSIAQVRAAACHLAWMSAVAAPEVARALAASGCAAPLERLLADSFPPVREFASSALDAMPHARLD